MWFHRISAGIRDRGPHPRDRIIARGHVVMRRPRGGVGPFRDCRGRRCSTGNPHLSGAVEQPCRHGKVPENEGAEPLEPPSIGCFLTGIRPGRTSMTHWHACVAVAVAVAARSPLRDPPAHGDDFATFLFVELNWDCGCLAVAVNRGRY